MAPESTIADLYVRNAYVSQSQFLISGNMLTFAFFGEQCKFFFMMIMMMMKSVVLRRRTSENQTKATLGTKPRLSHNSIISPLPFSHYQDEDLNMAMVMMKIEAKMVMVKIEMLMMMPDFQHFPLKFEHFLYGYSNEFLKTGH